VLVVTAGTSVEVQVRSALQHLWAELSERLADVVDSSIKYGGGEQQVRRLLSFASEHIAELEEFEKEMKASPEEAIGEQRSELQRIQESITRAKNSLAESFRDYISKLERNQR